MTDMLLLNSHSIMSNENDYFIQHSSIFKRVRGKVFHMMLAIVVLHSHTLLILHQQQLLLQCST